MSFVWRDDRLAGYDWVAHEVSIPFVALSETEFAGYHLGFARTIHVTFDLHPAKFGDHRAGGFLEASVDQSYAVYILCVIKVAYGQINGAMPVSWYLHPFLHDKMRPEAPEKEWKPLREYTCVPYTELPWWP